MVDRDDKAADDSTKEDGPHHKPGIDGHTSQLGLGREQLPQSNYNQGTPAVKTKTMCCYCVNTHCVSGGIGVLYKVVQVQLRGTGIHEWSAPNLQSKSPQLSALRGQSGCLE